MCGYPIVPVPSVERAILSPQRKTFEPTKKINLLLLCGYPDSLIHSFDIYLSGFIPIAHCLDCYSFLTSFGII